MRRITKIGLFATVLAMTTAVVRRRRATDNETEDETNETTEE